MVQAPARRESLNLKVKFVGKGAESVSVIFVLGCVALLCVGKGPDQTRFFLSSNACVCVCVCLLLLRRAVRCGQCGAQVRRRGPALRAPPFFALALLFLKTRMGHRTAGDGGRTHARPRRVVSRRVAWLFQPSR